MPNYHKNGMNLKNIVPMLIHDGVLIGFSMKKEAKARRRMIIKE
jgi:hypothetical protein